MTLAEKERYICELMSQHEMTSSEFACLRGVALGLEWSKENNQVTLDWIITVISQWKVTEKERWV